MVTAALPFLDAMVPALSAAPNSPFRKDVTLNPKAKKAFTFDEDDDGGMSCERVQHRRRGVPPTGA